ncbi:MAG TPA: DEAD/DEAH box helicase, partial [Chitinophagales bacterium]|nr:DEAD/DEAH box helicase [Chitinophagales bacterium]HNL17492.1 DEAD/DEAH box helicase [Chitinophagales bacterium]
AADYVFLVDPWWNTAIQDQAIDRTHRIGQTKNVFAYKMICKDTIEEKIIQIQSRKQATSDALIVAEDSFVKNLSQEDIAFLFD